MGGKKPLRRPLWPPTRATASNYYPLGLDGAGGAAKPLLRAPKKPAPLHGRLPAFSGAVDAFERARKCFLEWRYFFSIILSEFLKNRVALHLRPAEPQHPIDLLNPAPIFRSSSHSPSACQEQVFLLFTSLIYKIFVFLSILNFFLPGNAIFIFCLKISFCSKIVQKSRDRCKIVL